MRRIQIYLEDGLDAAVAQEAARRDMSKAALIREILTHELKVDHQARDPWEEMIGWLDDEPIEGIDENLYGPSR